MLIVSVITSVNVYGVMTLFLSTKGRLLVSFPPSNRINVGSCFDTADASTPCLTKPVQRNDKGAPENITGQSSDF